MKILAIYRHYWPDTTPYARLLRMILERLAAEGHDVSTFTAQPSYNDALAEMQPWQEVLGGVQVLRTPLLPERKQWRLVRVANALLFLLKAIGHATLFKRYDLLIANAHPPVAIGVALRTIAWLTGAKYVIHLQDIHPESAAEVGDLSRGRLYHLTRRLDAGACHHADLNVTLSDDMRRSLETRTPRPAAIAVINNCAQAKYESDHSPTPISLGDPGKTRLLFAGNLGRFQALEAVAGATGIARRRDQLSLTFMGAGILRDRLAESAPKETVRFIDRQPLAMANAAMSEADYGIVSLEPGVIRYAYPSKTMGYLAAGCPLLLVAEPDSELAAMVREERLGIVAAAATPTAIADAFDEAVARRGEWTPAERRRVIDFGERRFGADKMLDSWSKLIRELAPPAYPNNETPSRAAA